MQLRAYSCLSLQQLATLHIGKVLTSHYLSRLSKSQLCSVFGKLNTLPFCPEASFRAKNYLQLPQLAEQDNGRHFLI